MFPNVYGNIKQEEVGDNPGLPLILTPFIEQGKIKQALTAAEVHFNGFKGIKTYAGYFTVKKNFNSNMFFWFSPRKPTTPTRRLFCGYKGAPEPPLSSACSQKMAPSR
jgi:vitellogenic carboxypeptidase-like protein